ncbi:V-type proton ATPase 116 kDa subunit a 1-like isoform X2 [Watersipora subatra]|uniref:V-type proton ATPase 116 kDa subunit a 1-like isoform X2 n=1 Tax=Watersipora subatra TaxID=2589382 RepID=UPI00355B3727
MGSLMRSEEMALCQLFLQSESAYSCISELGELGVVQFRDLNPDVSSFLRKFVSEVRRCDEMERKLRYIEKEIKKDKIPVLDVGDNPDAPAPREMIDLEASFEKLENELREVNCNAEALKRNYLELTELKYILKKTQQFFDEHEHSLQADAHEALMQAEQILQPQALHLGFVAGVILWEKLPAFERMLWRACRGNVFLKQSVIDEALEDPVSGDAVNKCVFIVFFQGDQLKTRVRKICEGFRATLYPCPESPAERNEMSLGVMTRIEDLNTVLGQTNDHRHRVLVLAAKNIQNWFIKVKKIKAIYHTLNMFNLDVTQKCLIAECWCATSDLDKVHLAIQRGQENSGSTIPSILNRMATSRKPPTYHRTNKFTTVFQSLIDAYGISSYQEVNPASFSIITFPFLFSVMFGDFGHGFIMFLAGLWMVLRERQLQANKSDNEIWNMFFGGRYLILMMGAFSVYAGFVYNDIYSLSINIFGSSWRVPEGIYSFDGEVKDWLDRATLEPSPYHCVDQNVDNRTYVLNYSTASYLGSPYPFGIDPIWAIATNKLTFINSFKMKLSVILGVLHMMFGIWVGLLNHTFFQNTINILCEFIPQVLFLTCTFLYLVVEIFYKWITWSDRKPEFETLTGCSPNLLIGMINMYLFTKGEYNNVNVTIDGQTTSYTCSSGNPVFGETGELVQTFLVVVTVVCIPWLLVPKPFLLWRRGYTKKPTPRNIQTGQPEDEEEIIHHDQLQINDESGGETHEEEESIGDIVVHQAIHTIEFCLGCVSHTASYLRLWALSLAHGQLSEVLWSMVLRIGLSTNGHGGGRGYIGAAVLVVVFPFWAVLTIAILLAMEGLSAFLHTLRLHWVEFNSKFYKGEGYGFEPFTFEHLMDDTSAPE